MDNALTILAVGVSVMAAGLAILVGAFAAVLGGLVWREVFSDRIALRRYRADRAIAPQAGQVWSSRRLCDYEILEASEQSVCARLVRRDRSYEATWNGRPESWEIERSALLMHLKRD